VTTILAPILTSRQQPDPLLTVRDVLDIEQAIHVIAAGIEPNTAERQALALATYWPGCKSLAIQTIRHIFDGGSLPLNQRRTHALARMAWRLPDVTEADEHALSRATPATVVPSLADRVAQGAALLDFKVPGWEQRINLDTLDIQMTTACVLGQVFGDHVDPYEYGADYLLLHDAYQHPDAPVMVAHGFAAPDTLHDPDVEATVWADLTAEWKRVIRQRLTGELRPDLGAVPHSITVEPITSEMRRGTELPDKATLVVRRAAPRPVGQNLQHHRRPRRRLQCVGLPLRRRHRGPGARHRGHVRRHLRRGPGGGDVRHIVQFSTGAASAEVAWRVANEHGPENVVCLTADTGVEDADNWRFAEQVIARLGCEWVRLADGRTPMQVGRDRRCVPSNRMAVCSQILKRDLLDKYRNEHYDPADSIVYLGYDWTEPHRVEAAQKHWAPWMVDCPLTRPPYLFKQQILDLFRDRKIEPPRLYAAGFSHANCGGGCVRGGQAQWERLLRWNRDRYLEWEAEEETSRAVLGKDVAILRDRTGGRTRSLPLRVFRERVEAQPTLFDANDWGACGCFMDGA
jgi:hypothetical protein